MATVAELKSALNQVIKEIRRLDGELNSFHRSTRQNVTEVAKSLRSTSSGADQKIDNALQNAIQAITKASNDLQAAANDARSYSNRI